MDAKRFDQIVKSLSAGGSRRGVLHVLAGLPFGGVLALLFGAKASDAKRRKEGNQKGKRRVGGENHKHRGRRRKHRNKRNHDNKHKDKKKCKPESVAKTCDGKCGTVKNNCQKSVDCGSCACEPACPVCRLCNEETQACDADPAQEDESCGGCRICQDGECVIDASVVCTAQDQCHEAGECDPETGECTNPRKPDDTPCDDEDACTTGESCQNGVCTGGTAADCSAEDDVCNDGVCRADGTCGKRPKPDGTSCNTDNDSCTAGDSCQGGVCTPGAGVDCGREDDQCNRGVCRQLDGVCIKEPRANDTNCNADGDACTEGDHCQDGACVPGPVRGCPVCQTCNTSNCQNVSSDSRCTTECCDGVCCPAGQPCVNNICQGPCLTTNAVCDPENDTCCGDEGEFCSESAACAGAGQGRCCRDEGAICSANCDCCDGVCSDGVCCQPNRQCNGTSDCCSGYVCINNVCEAACGTENSICTDIACCDGFRCVDGECWPDICLAPTEQCTTGSQCCQDGAVDCRTTVDSFPDEVCCRPFGQACDRTVECCGTDVCGPQGKCCRGGFLDPDRGGEFARGCIGRESECCPGRRCNPISNICCLEDGQPVAADRFIDCCHFTRENGVCSCQGTGETCSNPFPGLLDVTQCCDGLICFGGRCEPPCLFPAAACGSGSLPCCGGFTCQNGFCLPPQ